MPSEQEQDRARQIEALRRHLAELASQRERPTELGVLREPLDLEPARRRPSPAWLVVTGLLVAVALVGGVFVGAVAWSDDRPAGGDTAAGTSSAARAPEGPAVAAVATPACKTAVDRANTMLASAVKLRGTLAGQDRILRDPAVQGLSGRELLERLTPAQQAAAEESARFDRALDAYRQVVDQCDLHVP